MIRGIRLNSMQRWALGVGLVITLGARSAAGASRVSSSRSYGANLYSVGVGGSLVSGGQQDINDLIKRANTREGGISTGELGMAYELNASFESRASDSDWGYLLRPAYFVQSADGSGAGGDFTYTLRGYSLILEFKRYVLENDSIHMYTQFGLGYGRLTGVIEENDKLAPGHGRVDYAGDALGLTIGIGADVCSESNHCLTVEGTFRRMTYDRLIAQKSNGAFDTAHGSLSQYGRKEEVEIDNHDLALDMGGLLFQMGYSYKF